MRKSRFTDERIVGSFKQDESARLNRGYGPGDCSESGEEPSEQ